MLLEKILPQNFFEEKNKRINLLENHFDFQFKEGKIIAITHKETNNQLIVGKHYAKEQQLISNPSLLEILSIETSWSGFLFIGYANGGVSYSKNIDEIFPNFTNVSFVKKQKSQLKYLSDANKKLCPYA